MTEHRVWQRDRLARVVPLSIANLRQDLEVDHKTVDRWLTILEWLARISDHIPDPEQHRTLFYGEYSNRVRGAAHCSEPDTSSVMAEPQPRGGSTALPTCVASDRPTRLTLRHAPPTRVVVLLNESKTVKRA